MTGDGTLDAWGSHLHRARDHRGEDPPASIALLSQLPKRRSERHAPEALRCGRIAGLAAEWLRPRPAARAPDQAAPLGMRFGEPFDPYGTGYSVENLQDLPPYAPSQGS